mmetsp:Transcript_17525/g.25348  ORF Transcript_17525/g.25348 Transcript_17525/m.25348 type:complete len:514 (+) Transcript_17525:61-1602(+)
MSQTGLANSVFLAHTSILFREAVASEFIIFEGTLPTIDYYVEKIWHEVEANYSEYSEEEKIQIAHIYAQQEVERLLENGENGDCGSPCVEGSHPSHDQDESNGLPYFQDGFAYFSALFNGNFPPETLQMIWESECQQGHADVTATVESACASALDTMEIESLTQEWQEKDRQEIVSEQTSQDAALQYVLNTVKDLSSYPLDPSVAEACLISCGYDVDAAIQQLESRSLTNKTRGTKWIPLSTFNSQSNNGDRRQSTPSSVRSGLSYANVLKRHNNFQSPAAQRTPQEELNNHNNKNNSTSNHNNNTSNHNNNSSRNNNTSNHNGEVEERDGLEVDANGSSLVVLANFPGERAICEHFRKVCVRNNPSLSVRASSCGRELLFDGPLLLQGPGREVGVSLDLHGLCVRYAMQLVRSLENFYLLQLSSASANSLSGSTTIADAAGFRPAKAPFLPNSGSMVKTRAVKVRLVVGRGRHSPGGVVRLAPAVKNYLRAKNTVFYSMENDAVIAYQLEIS